MNYPGLPELVLIEDSMDDEFLSLRGINNSGIECNVTVRRHGKGAFDLLQSNFTPVPSLIVLDFNLPDLSGLEVLREVRRIERLQCVPVVILSGRSVGRELMDCYRSGANSCVVKPFDAKEYVDHVALIVCYWLTVNCALNKEGPLEKRPNVSLRASSANLPAPPKKNGVIVSPTWGTTHLG